MSAKLYPPQISGTLPAFWLTYDSSNLLLRGADIKIPFSMNQVVSATSVKGFMLRLRTASSGSYIFSPIFSNDYNMSENIVTFHLTASQAAKLNEGQFYKVQIAYCSSTVENASGTEESDSVGYFSTVGIIKCTSQPTVYISNLSQENINLFTNQFIGIYDQTDCRDQTEKVYSYEFVVYNGLGEVYYTTGEQLHKSYYDTKMDVSLDAVLLNDFMDDSTSYSIQYKVITINGLELATPKYSLTSDGLVAPNKTITIKPSMDDETGSTIINFKGEINNERSFYYILNEQAFETIEVDDPSIFTDDSIIISDTSDIYSYNYTKDAAGKTPIDKIKQGISNAKDKITFIESKTLYRRWKKDIYNRSNFYYSVDDKSPDKMSLVAGKYYFYDSDLLKILQKENLTKEYKRTLSKLDQWPEELIQSWEFNIDDLVYFEIITDCEDIVQRISYQDVIDNPLIDIDKYETSGLLLTTSEFESLYYGSYILLRASNDDNYSTWYIINRFRLDDQRPSSYSIKDVTIEHGKKYKYALTQYNLWGLQSSKNISDVYQAGFEDAYLYDGEKTLRIRYNPEVSSFKITVLEQKSDTLGGRFPFISRNGDTFYREFPIAGLLAQELDIDNSFCNKEVPIGHRHATGSEEPIHENVLRDWHMFSDANIALEREFKMNVLEWLNNGKPKLFKSPYEGNFIVRLLNNSLTPIKELGRMLHNFQSQAYEIAECTYENLVAYGFIKTGYPSDYVGLFKTYKLTDDSLFDTNGNVDIQEADNGGIVSFVIQDMWPGDIVYVTFFDGTTEEIMIGITGSYTYVGDKKVSRIFIPQYQYEKIHRNIIGTINCYYYGARITAFDAIRNMQLKTIPSAQFIGIDPHFYKLRSAEIDPEKNSELTINSTEFNALSDYDIRDYITKLGSMTDDNEFYIKNEKGSDKLALYKRMLNSYEPGDLIGRINATLNSGETSKLELMKLEYGKFRLRELIPVYEVNINYNTTEYVEHDFTGQTYFPPNTYYYYDSELKQYILDSGNAKRKGIIYYDKASRDFPLPGTNEQQMFANEYLIKEDSSFYTSESNIGTVYVSVSPFGYPYPIEELTETVLLDPFCVFQVFRRANGAWVPVNRPVQWRDNEVIYTSYYDPYYKTWIPYYEPYVQINYKWKKIVYAPYGFDIDLSNEYIQEKELLIKEKKESLKSLQQEYPKININEIEENSTKEGQDIANQLLKDIAEIEEELSVFGSSTEERARIITFCAKRRKEMEYINKGRDIFSTANVEHYQIQDNDGYYFIQDSWDGSIDDGVINYSPINLEEEGLKYKPYTYYYRLENGEYTKDSDQIGPQVYYTSKILLQTYAETLIKCVVGNDPDNEEADYYYLSQQDISRYTVNPNDSGNKITFSYRDPNTNEIIKFYTLLSIRNNFKNNNAAPFYMPVIINVNNINKTYYLTRDQFYILVDSHVQADYTVIKEDSTSEIEYLENQAKITDTNEIKLEREAAIEKAQNTTYDISNYRYTTSLEGYETTCHDEYYNCYICNNKKYYLSDEQKKQLLLTPENNEEDISLCLIPVRQYYLQNLTEYNYTYNNRISLSTNDCFESFGNTYLVTDDTEIIPYKIYCFKEYDNSIDLMAVREEDYTQLSDVNSIRIGSGVMAELTFQLKVLDFYTEIRQPAVAAAKQAYLDAKQFFTDLLKSYSILEDSDTLARKNDALQELYYKLIHGTELYGKLSKTSQDYLKNILQSESETEKFNFLKLYEVTSVNQNLGSELITQVIKSAKESREKYPDTFAYENLKLFIFTDDIDTVYHIIDINRPDYYKENSNNLSWYYQINNSQETGIYFAIDKDKYFVSIDDEENCLPFLSKDEKGNISIELLDKKIITNNGYTVYPLTEQSDITLISSHLELLNKSEHQALLSTDTTIEIREIRYENGKVIYVDSQEETQEESITKTFFEEEEVKALVNDEEEEVKGTQHKQEVSNTLLDNFRNELEESKKILNDIKEKYITYYTDIKNNEGIYNESVYQRWAVDQIIFMIKNRQPLTLIDLFMFLQNQLTLIEDKTDELVDHYQEIVKYYDAIIGNLSNIKDLLKNRIENVAYRREMIKDNFNDVALDNQLKLSILDDFGYSVFYMFLIYYLVDKIKTKYEVMLSFKNDESPRYTENQYNQVKKYIREIYQVYNSYYEKIIKDFDSNEVKDGVNYVLRLWKNSFLINDDLLKTMLNNLDTVNYGDGELQAFLSQLEIISPLYDDIFFMYTDSSKDIKDLEIEIDKNTKYTFTNLRKTIQIIEDRTFLTDDVVFNDSIVNLRTSNEKLGKYILDQLGNDKSYYNHFQDTVVDRTYFHRTLLYRKPSDNSINNLTEEKQEAIKRITGAFIFFPLNTSRLDTQIQIQYGSKAYESNYDFYDKKLNLFQKEEVLNISEKLNGYLLEYLQQFLENFSETDNAENCASESIQDGNTYKDLHYYNIMSTINEESKLSILKNAITTFNDFVASIMNEYGYILFDVDENFSNLIKSMQFPQVNEANVKSRDYFFIPENLYTENEGRALVSVSGALSEEIKYGLFKGIFTKINVTQDIAFLKQYYTDYIEELKKHPVSTESINGTYYLSESQVAALSNTETSLYNVKIINETTDSEGVKTTTTKYASLDQVNSYAQKIADNLTEWAVFDSELVRHVEINGTYYLTESQVNQLNDNQSSSYDIKITLTQKDNNNNNVLNDKYTNYTFIKQYSTTSSDNTTKGVIDISKVPIESYKDIDYMLIPIVLEKKTKYTDLLSNLIAKQTLSEQVITPWLTRRILIENPLIQLKEEDLAADWNNRQIHTSQFYGWLWSDSNRLTEAQTRIAGYQTVLRNIAQELLTTHRYEYFVGNDYEWNTVINDQNYKNTEVLTSEDKVLLGQLENLQQQLEVLEEERNSKLEPINNWSVDIKVKLAEEEKIYATPVEAREAINQYYDALVKGKKEEMAEIHIFDNSEESLRSIFSNTYNLILRKFPALYKMPKVQEYISIQAEVNAATAEFTENEKFISQAQAHLERIAEIDEEIVSLNDIINNDDTTAQEKEVAQQTLNAITRERANIIAIYDKEEDATENAIDEALSRAIQQRAEITQRLAQAQEKVSNLNITTVKDNSLSEEGAFADFVARFEDYYLKTKDELINQTEQLLLLYEKQAENYREKYETYKDLFEENKALFENFKAKYPQIWEYYESQKGNGDSLVSLSEIIDDQRLAVRAAWKKFLNLLDYYYTAEKKAGLYV